MNDQKKTDLKKTTETKITLPEIKLKDLLSLIAAEGFTKGTAKAGISQLSYKTMCEELIKAGYLGLTPFTTKQQILYVYIAVCCVEDLPLFK